MKNEGLSFQAIVILAVMLLILILAIRTCAATWEAISIPPPPGEYHYFGQNLQGEWVDVKCLWNDQYHMYFCSKK